MDDDSVIIRDVTLRDGLQNLKDFIPTDVKVELFRMIATSGIRKIEFTAFVSPKAVPQFRDASQVARAVLSIKPEGVEICALIPNLKGAQLALEKVTGHHLGLNLLILRGYGSSSGSSMPARTGLRST